MSPTATPPGPARSSDGALSAAVARIRRILIVAAVVLVAAQALWVLALGARAPLATLLVGAAATTALLASIWVLLARMVRSGVTALAGWVAGGYLLRIGILLVALLGGRAAGLDVRVIGITLIVAIVVGLIAEALVLSRARIPVVDTEKPGTGA